MAIGIKITVDGQDRVLRRIDKISKIPSNLMPIYKQWANILREEWKRNFETESGYGLKWGALKYRRPKKYEGLPIGVNTGEMKGAVAGGSGSVTDISNKRMEIGVGLPKAVVFHRGKNNQVARPIVTLTNSTKNKLMQSLRLYINREMKA